MKNLLNDVKTKLKQSEENFDNLQMSVKTLMLVIAILISSFTVAHNKRADYLLQPLIPLEYTNNTILYKSEDTFKYDLHGSQVMFKKGKLYKHYKTRQCICLVKTTGEYCYKFNR